MVEKVYKTMAQVGTGNIVVGIIIIVAGVVAGIMTIIGGALLLKGKAGLTF